MINGQIDNYTATIYTLQKHNFDFGLNSYTIWNEDYRPILNKAILDFYMFHEIGYTNPNVFKHYLSARMDLIMRNKYNAMFSAKAKEFNPLYTLDVYDDYSHSVENINTGETNVTTNANNNTVATSDSTTNTDASSTNATNTTNTSDVSNDALALVSNYPSENMVNNDLTSNVYVNNGQKNTTSTNTNDTSDENTTSSDTTEVKATSSDNTTATLSGTDKTTNSGNTKTTETYSKHSYGSASDLSFAHAMVQFKDYCEQFRIDEQIISELSDLFINVY